MITQEIKDAICVYHRRGYQYRLIHYLLEKRHNCSISYSYLEEKVIPSLGLKRRGRIDADFDEIIRISSVEISNGLAGSEQLRKTLSVKYNIRIPREVSRQLVRCLDEEGVKRRKANRLRRRLYISKHQQTIDTKFGPGIPGGGNRKGRDLRKVNLDRAIHNPQDSIDD